MSYQKDFQQNNYVLVKKALTEQTAKLATAYTLLDEQNNYNPIVDAQIGDDPVHWSYGDLLMESMMFILNPVINEITQKKCLPTYSYYRVYRSGLQLKPHFDRPECEISASICLGMMYPPEYKGWPLYLDGNPLYMEPGDMAIYKGMEIKHWREPFDVPEGYFQSQVFIHFVDKDGPYANRIYDGRSRIGER